MVGAGAQECKEMRTGRGRERVLGGRNTCAHAKDWHNTEPLLLRMHNGSVASRMSRVYKPHARVVGLLLCWCISNSVVMGAEASALEERPRGSTEEPARDTTNRIDSSQTSRKEIQCMEDQYVTLIQKLKAEKEEYESQLKIQQDRRDKKMKELTEEIEELKKCLRALKESNNRLNTDNEVRTKTEDEIPKELQEVIATNKKFREEYDAELESMRLRYASDMNILIESNRELKDELRASKSAIYKLTTSNELRMKVEEELRKELQAVEATNKKFANNKLTRGHEEELQMEMQAVETGVPANSLQLAGTSSAPQGITGEEKVSLKAFEFIRNVTQMSLQRRASQGTSGTNWRRQAPSAKQGHCFMLQKAPYDDDEEEERGGGEEEDGDEEDDDKE